MNFLKRLWNTYTWQPKLIALGVLFVLILVVVFSFKGCGKSQPMTERERQEVKNAIADRDEQKLKEKLVELEVKEKQIDANVAGANTEKVNAIHESRQKWANANISELQAEFDRRMNQ